MLRSCLPLLLLAACAPAEPPLLIDESNQSKSAEHRPQGESDEQSRPG